MKGWRFLSAFIIFMMVLTTMASTSVQAGPEDDLEVVNLYGPAGTPPPRANVEYEIIAEWSNNGDDSYDATVRLFSDCDQDDLADESDTITMGAGESDTVTLEITFDETGEVCYSATIYYSSSDYGIFENYINVEPETGDADLFVDFDIDGDEFSAGQSVEVVFEYGNEGDVSTLNPVTIMAYFDEVDEEPTNYFDPTPYTFAYISPPSPDAPPEPETMEWSYTIPSDTEDGEYKFTVIIDSDENNTEEDPDLDNNVDVWEVCVGDCSDPDLRVWDNGIDSISCEPLDPVGGDTVSFKYSIENTGEGDAEPPEPGDGWLVMHLEVMKCPDGDCSGQSWTYTNQSKSVRTTIEGGEVFTSDDILAVNWSTTSDDAGFWNVRIVVDGEDVIEETDEDNNNLDWYTVYAEYFELKETRPDLIVTDIDEGTGEVFVDETRTIQVAVSQTDLGDRIADDVDVFIRIKDPEDTVTSWFKIDDSKTVGLTPDTTIFEYAWTPTKLGVYEFYAWVDRDEEILEWDDTNNQYDNDKYIEVVSNIGPTAAITISPDSLGGLTPEYCDCWNLTFSARNSSDPDGTIVAYRWWFNNELVSEEVNWTTSFDAGAFYQIKLEVQDNNGTWSSKLSINIKVVSDVPPTISASAEPLYVAIGETVWLNGSAVRGCGNITTYTWYVESGVISNETDTQWVPTEEGSYFISFRVDDDKENGREIGVATVQVFNPNIPPVAVIDSITPSLVRFDRIISFNGSGTDNNGTISAYEWISDIDGFLSDKEDFYHTGLTAGNHSISFRVLDNDTIFPKRWSEWVTAVLIVTPNSQPVGIIDSISPSPAEAGITVFFNSTGTDDNLTIVSYLWKSTIDGNLSEQRNFSASDLSIGYHIIALQVLDNDGVWSSSVSQELWIYVSPVAIAGQDSTGTPGVPLQFSGAATDEDGTVILYEWDFDGDGIFEWSSTENGRELNIYNNEGTYTATLRVTDNDGFTDTDTVEITISEKKVQIDDEGNVTVTDAGEDEEGIPSVSLISSIAAIGIIALRRRS